MAAQSAGAKQGGKNLKDIHVCIGSLFPPDSLTNAFSYL